MCFPTLSYSFSSNCKPSNNYSALSALISNEVKHQAALSQMLFRRITYALRVFREQFFKTSFLLILEHEEVI